MFDRFSDDAKRAMTNARLEAIRLGHDYIDVEHMLLGMLRAPVDAVRALVQAAGGDAARAVAAIDAITTAGRGNVMGQLPFTPRSKKALENALETAARCGHDWLGIEHMLIGAVRTAERGVAAALEQARLGAEDLLRAFTANGDVKRPRRRQDVSRVLQFSFTLDAAVANIAELELLLDGHAAAAEHAQQTAAAAVLRDLLAHCVRARAALRGKA